MSLQLVFKTDYSIGILNVPQFRCHKRKSSTPEVFSFSFWGQRSKRDPDLKVRDGWYSTIACLQENVSVGMQRVKTKVFIQDPFNPVLFTENVERHVDVCYIICALTSLNYRLRYLRAWRRWCCSSLWCASTCQWSCHYWRGSWDS